MDATYHRHDISDKVWLLFKPHSLYRYLGYFPRLTRVNTI